MKNQKKGITGDNSNKLSIYGWSMNLLKNRVGHVSARTYKGGTYDQGIYMSFWPNSDEDTPKKEDVHKKMRDGITGSHPRNLEEDIRNEEGQQPDFVVHLYGLDIKKINQLYQKFRQGNYNWSIFGSSLFKDEDTHNCSSLLAVLLNEGGITNLVPSFNLNLEEGTRNSDSAVTKTAFVATIGSAATLAKIETEVDIKKVVATAKVAFTITAGAMVFNSSITPNDIIKLCGKARKAELELYEIENDENVEETRSSSKKFCSIS